MKAKHIIKELVADKKMGTFKNINGTWKLKMFREHFKKIDFKCADITIRRNLDAIEKDRFSKMKIVPIIGNITKLSSGLYGIEIGTFGNYRRTL